ncbi:MAG TPA: TetR family transcriptional regulator [Solirubrobacterales bacterium]|jgi:AcrR family transcriptional regulator|nr:TetR family transcriptional regulator [Solirubrobacterales bacterium]
MTIPPSTAPCWSDLESDAKRFHLLRTAGEVFARDGLDAPMPAIAAAAGAGIGSVYRQFPSKNDLLAALVVERLETVTEEADAALADARGPWAALTALLWALAERQAADDVLAEAVETVSEQQDVQEAMAATIASLERLLDAAREGGRLRPDATALDLRLVLAATRAARRLEPGAWRRMLQLGIDALDADASRPPGR